MTTPSQLRQKADKQIEDAHLLLQNNSPDNAKQAAGLALEFMLKARLCTRRGWARIPDSEKEAKIWNERDGREKDKKTLTHDLNALLSLNDIDRITFTKFTYTQADWEVASNWDVSERYHKIGTISAVEASTYVEEVEKVIASLREYELVEACAKIEIELSRDFGIFDCFVLVQSPEIEEKWIILCSFIDATPELTEERNKRLNELITQLDGDLRNLIHRAETWSINAPVVLAIISQASLMGGVRHSTRAMHSDNIVQVSPETYIKLPPGYFITAGKWAQNLVEESWKQADKEGQ